MKTTETPEELLQSCLARCEGAIAARMAKADATTSYTIHGDETKAAIALLNAAARVGAALARLRGTTTNIRVTREIANEGSNGQKNR